MFDFELPPELIAQHPAPERDQSRLLVVERRTGTLAHRRFFELPSLLRPGDLLILNDTRVVPARLLGKRIETGGKWEGLFLREAADGCWELLCQTRGRLWPGDRIQVEPGPLQLELCEHLPGGAWLARPSAAGAAHTLLAQHGQVPLPPYIRKGRAANDDYARYQTVYAQATGAVAAPTAGLHFTPRLFDALAEHGIGWSHVTLHVGWGTFQPLQSDDWTQHRMHSEWGEITAATVAVIDACRARGGRVIAVGTTATRVLETAAATGTLQPWRGETALFIHPPYRFRVVDALLTNFHLPRTTLLLLVSALAGTELLAQAYGVAIAERYRFYSYGDAMLVL